MAKYIEIVRYKVTNGRTIEARQFYIDGPTLELERQVAWAAQVDARDGWYVVKDSVQFGTMQNGEFRERVTRRTPVIAFDGFRRLASHLRA